MKTMPTLIVALILSIEANVVLLGFGIGEVVRARHVQAIAGTALARLHRVVAASQRLTASASALRLACADTDDALADRNAALAACVARLAVCEGMRP